MHAYLYITPRSIARADGIVSAGKAVGIRQIALQWNVASEGKGAEVMEVVRTDEAPLWSSTCMFLVQKGRNFSSVLTGFAFDIHSTN